MSRRWFIPLFGVLLFGVSVGCVAIQNAQSPPLTAENAERLFQQVPTMATENEVERLLGPGRPIPSTSLFVKNAGCPEGMTPDSYTWKAWVVGGCREALACGFINGRVMASVRGMPTADVAVEYSENVYVWDRAYWLPK